MNTFQYEAMNRQGQEVKGEIEATTSEDVLAHIRNLGYFPTRIREKGSHKCGVVETCEVDMKRKNPLEGIFSCIPLGLLVFALGLVLIVPLCYWWQHDDLTQMQVMKGVWETELLGIGIILGLLWWAHRND